MQEKVSCILIGLPVSVFAWELQEDLLISMKSQGQIVHRDVKASNILIDGKLCPKISNFGLAKLYDDTKTHISTRVAGTM